MGLAGAVELLVLLLQPELLQHLVELPGVQGLPEEGERPEAQDLGLGILLHVSGEDDYEDVAVFRPQPFENLVAVHDGHVQVKEHEFAEPVPDDIQRLFAVAGLLEVLLERFRENPDELLSGEFRVITDDYR